MKSKQAMELEAVVDIFSGRENPNWKLSASEAEFARTALKDLKECEPVNERSKLGYHGIWIVNCDNDLNFPKKIIAYKSCITLIEHSGNIRYLKDEANIEKWLKSLAKEKCCLSLL